MGRYVEASDLFAEGVPSSINEALLEARILKWERIVEGITQNIFYVYDPGELIFDGSNMRYLHFNIPLVDVTSVKINGEDYELPTDQYRAYTGKQAPRDDRGNPKIELTDFRRSIFRRYTGMFAKGYDQKITARWGYVEEDPNNPGQFITPPLIKQAVMQLVVRDLEGYWTAQSCGKAAPWIMSPLKRERTDDHEVEYMQVEDVRATWMMLPRDVQDILALFRGPLRIGVPDHRRFIEIPNAGVGLWMA